MTTNDDDISISTSKYLCDSPHPVLSSTSHQNKGLECPIQSNISIYLVVVSMYSVLQVDAQLSNNHFHWTRSVSKWITVVLATMAGDAQERSVVSKSIVAEPVTQRQAMNAVGL